MHLFSFLIRPDFLLLWPWYYKRKSERAGKWCPSLLKPFQRLLLNITVFTGSQNWIIVNDGSHVISCRCSDFHRVRPETANVFVNLIVVLKKPMEWEQQLSDCRVSRDREVWAPTFASDIHGVEPSHSEAESWRPWSHMAITCVSNGSTGQYGSHGSTCLYVQFMERKPSADVMWTC